MHKSQNTEIIVAKIHIVYFIWIKFPINLGVLYKKNSIKINFRCFLKLFEIQNEKEILNMINICILGDTNV